tara:strand:+ start:610 stop:852 length:243 start_codon:yes stop_codon:yes gene_type:complete
LNKVLEDILFTKLKQNLDDMGGSIEEISKDADLLKAGILDSMEFVELISEFSKETGNSIETVLNENGDLCISINWFIKNF